MTPRRSLPRPRWKGRGYKYVQRAAEDRLSRAWRAVCDDQGDGFIRSRRVTEADWARELGLDCAVSCDFSANGNSTLALRFSSGKPQSPQFRVNEELLASAERREPPSDEGPSGLPPDEGPSGPPPEPPPATPPAPPSVSEPALTAPTPTAGDAPEAATPASNAADVVYIDLETRSACDLPQCGGRRVCVRRHHRDSVRRGTAQRPHPRLDAVVGAAGADRESLAGRLPAGPAHRRLRRLCVAAAAGDRRRCRSAVLSPTTPSISTRTSGERKDCPSRASG